MKNKTNKTGVKNRKSLRGKWGKVGAPPKATKWPATPFTMETLFGRNANQCQLSLRTKVDAGLEAGQIIALKTKKQAGGKVGRPKSVFVMKENYDSSKHELLGSVSAPKTRKTRAPKVKAEAQAVETVAVVDVISPVTPPVAAETVEPGMDASSPSIIISEPAVEVRPVAAREIEVNPMFA